MAPWQPEPLRRSPARLARGNPRLFSAIALFPVKALSYALLPARQSMLSPCQGLLRASLPPLWLCTARQLTEIQLDTQLLFRLWLQYDAVLRSEERRVGKE